MITPVNRSKLHYWFAGCRNFARHNNAVNEFMHKARIAAFSEDQFALEQIDRLQQVDRSGGIEEMHIPTDSAGIAMRRHLKALSDREQLAG